MSLKTLYPTVFNAICLSEIFFQNFQKLPNLVALSERLSKMIKLEQIANIFLLTKNREST